MTAAVHVLDMSTSREIRVGSDLDTRFRDTRPRWSPDGTFLAFATKSGDVYVVRPDGTGRRWIVRGDPPGGNPTYEPSWSPDGTRLAIVKDGHLYTVDVATRKLRLLVPSRYPWNPAWSPDGKWIAFVGDTHGPALATYAVSTGRLPVLRLLDGRGVLGLYWSRDSTAIVSQDFAPGCCTMTVYLTPLDGSGRKPLTEGFLYGPQPWSPDGTKIVFTPPARGESDGLYVINRDGSGKTRLTRDYADEDPSWSPDGRSIVFRRRDGLFAAKADGTGETRLNRDPDPFMSSMEPEWQPLAAALSVSAKPAPCARGERRPPHDRREKPRNGSSPARCRASSARPRSPADP